MDVVDEHGADGGRDRVIRADRYGIQAKTQLQVYGAGPAMHAVAQTSRDPVYPRYGHPGREREIRLPSDRGQ